MEKWLLSVALGKITKRLVSFAVGAFIAGAAQANASKVGVNVEVDPVVLTGSCFAGVELLRNWLKVKTGFKWL